jgi:hypothetical protein
MATIFDAGNANMTGGANSAAAFAGGGVPLQSMNSYVNPHRRMVLDDTLSRMGDNFQNRTDQIGDMAGQSGAYGGSRHGLMESQAFGDYNRNVGEVSNASNSAGFNDAMGYAFRDADMMQRGGNDMFNMGMGQYNLGRNVMNDQMGYGQMQQGLNQGILDQAGGWLSQYLNSPMDSTGGTAGIIGGSPLGNNQTQNVTPGLMDWIGLGAQVAGGGK